MDKTLFHKSLSPAYLLLAPMLAAFLLLIALQTELDAAPMASVIKPEALPDSTLVDAPICRYGVSSFTSQDNPYLESLGVGWVLDFSVRLTRGVPSGVEYTPMVRFEPVKDPVTKEYIGYTVATQPLTDEPDGLGPIVEANPGRLWLVGNEVDRVFWQDDLTPELYAEAYHDTYHFIKERDPSARIAISGLVQVTPGRLQYLDLVWDAYLEKYGTSIPVDVWNMHIYIMPERREYQPGDNPDAAYYGSRAGVAIGTDPNLAIWESDGTSNQCARDDVYCYAEHDDIDIFMDQVVAMRQWMKSKGQQNKPLILSEFSLLYPYDGKPDGACYLQDEYGKCFTPTRVANFMNATLDYLETAANTNLGYPADNYKLVQQWLWFTMYLTSDADPKPVYNMLEADGDGNYSGFTLNGTTYQSRNTAVPRTVSHVIVETSTPVAYTVAPTNTTSVSLTAKIRNNGTTTADTPVDVTFYADAGLTQPIGTATISDPLYGCAMQETAVSVTWDNLSSGAHSYWVQVDSDDVVSGLVIIDPESIYLPTITR